MAGCTIDSGATMDFTNETGELVVATEPAESAVIAIRPIAGEDAEVCTADDWKWSGVGDHD